MIYSANNRVDLNTLANKINGLEKEMAWQFISKVHGAGLMKVRAPDALPPMITKEMFDEVVNNANPKYYDVLFAGISKTMPEEIDEFLYQTIDHMLYGKDTEDQDSVGGFSQREINILVDILESLE